MIFSDAAAWEYIFRVMGDSLHDNIGEIIEGIGDQNQDGYDDILVKVQRTREFRIYYGGERMDTDPDWSIHAWDFGRNIGDVNNDGIPDFFIMLRDTNGQSSCPIFYGGDEDTIPDLFLQLNSLAFRGGDVNGDGYDDVFQVWSGYNYPQPERWGRIFLYLGSEDGLDTIPDYAIHGDWERANLGGSFSSGGDLNGDGYDDFYCYSDRREGYRNLNFFFGGEELDTVPAFQYNTQDSLSEYPVSPYVVIINDLNDDGFDELMMGITPGPSSMIIFGQEDFHLRPGLILEYGALQPVSLGDVNDDEYNDLLCMNYLDVGGLGRINLHLGGYWVNDECVLQITGWDREVLVPLGAGVCYTSCGDVNGDGFNDIMFSASGNSTGNNSRGEVYIIGGSDEWEVGVDEDIDSRNYPAGFKITDVYPNPFNRELKIGIAIRNAVNLDIKVYNLSGSLVSRIASEYCETGERTFTWQPEDIAAGIYFIAVSDGISSKYSKVLLLK